MGDHGRLTGEVSEFGMDLEAIFSESMELATVTKQGISVGAANKLADKYKHIQTEIDKYKMWMETETGKLKKQKEFIKDYLHAFMLDQYESGGGKSFNLPNGAKLALRKAPEKLVLPDDPMALHEALLWAKENVPDAVKTVETLLKTEIKNHLKRTGELPPHVEISAPDEMTFSVT